MKDIQEYSSNLKQAEKVKQFCVTKKNTLGKNNGISTTYPINYHPITVTNASSNQNQSHKLNIWTGDTHSQILSITSTPVCKMHTRQNSDIQIQELAEPNSNKHKNGLSIIQASVSFY